MSEDDMESLSTLETGSGATRTESEPGNVPQVGSAATDISATADAGLRLCSHCKIMPVRGQGQHYCRNCHNAASKFYRARNKRQFARVMEAVHQMTIENTPTKQKFEELCGTSRRVLVLCGIGEEQIIDFSADVIRFLPDEKLEVRVPRTGQVRVVNLAQVKPDLHYAAVAEGCERERENALNGIPWRRPLRPKGDKGSYLPDEAHTAAWRREQRKWEKAQRRPRA